MFKKIIFFLVFTSSILATQKDESVVCIHGFMGAKWNMGFLQKNLKEDGWEVFIWDYPSRDKIIEDHGKDLVKYLKTLAKQKPGKAIHFVTHSMGSLVLLTALNNKDCPIEAKTGRVVLIAPPINGSSFGRYLSKFTLARWIAKDYSGNQLMSSSNFEYLGNFPQSLQDILIISGTLGFNPVLKEKNDGTVALKETCIKNHHKHCFVNREHTTIIFSKKVCRFVKSFLNQK